MYTNLLIETGLVYFNLFLCLNIGSGCLSENETGNTSLKCTPIFSSKLVFFIPYYKASNCMNIPIYLWMHFVFYRMYEYYGIFISFFLSSVISQEHRIGLPHSNHFSINPFCIIHHDEIQSFPIPKTSDSSSY